LLAAATWRNFLTGARCQNPPPSAASSLRIILHLLFTGVLTFLWDEQDLKLFSLLIVAVF
jgi:hypothetical protein